MAFLEILTGELAGTRCTLSDGHETLLGRDAACHVTLTCPMISRRHARFYLDEGHFYVDDLRTVNGTFLNARRIEQPTRLADGDRINLFNVALLFHARDPGPAEFGANSAPQHPERVEEPQAGETVILPPKTQPECEAVQDDVGPETEARGACSSCEFAAAEAEARLQSVVEITRKLGSSLHMDEVLPRVLDILFETFPHAVNGQILLLNSRGDLIPKALKQGRDDDSAIIPLTPVSSSVARQVIQTGQIALSEEYDGESALTDSICASVAAPIIGPSRQPLGAIHLECGDAGRRFDKADLDLLAAVTAAAGQAVEYMETHQTLLSVDRKEHELKMAREVQLRMLPKRRPDLPGYSFHDYYGPAGEVGGDFYSYLPTADGRVVLTVGDVVGKGLTAALRMAQIVSEIRHAVTEAGSLKRAMNQLNRVVYGSEDETEFITLVMCVIDSQKNTATIAHAGHLPPLWRHKRSNTVEVLNSDHKGFPLGVVPEQEFHPDTYQLESGDALLLYTDGVTEAVNPDGKLYGIERVRQAMNGITSGAAPLLRFLVNDVVSYRGGKPPSDDICLVCVKRDDEDETARR